MQNRKKEEELYRAFHIFKCALIIFAISGDVCVLTGHFKGGLAGHMEKTMRQSNLNRTKKRSDATIIRTLINQLIILS